MYFTGCYSLYVYILMGSQDILISDTKKYDQM